MAKQNTGTKRVRIKNDPNHPGRGVITGVGKSAKPGETVEFDRWTANHLIAADVAEEVK